jgi:hypothetical protein
MPADMMCLLHDFRNSVRGTKRRTDPPHAFQVAEIVANVGDVL